MEVFNIYFYVKTLLILSIIDDPILLVYKWKIDYFIFTFVYSDSECFKIRLYILYLLYYIIYQIYICMNSYLNMNDVYLK